MTLGKSGCPRAVGGTHVEGIKKLFYDFQFFLHSQNRIDENVFATLKNMSGHKVVGLKVYNEITSGNTPVL